MTPAAAHSIPAAFDAVAAAQAQRTAIVCGDDRMSYADLANRSERIAALLRQQGVRPGDIVGLFMPRSPAVIAAMLGVLKAGAAYLPFDPSYPIKLLRYIYEDAAPSRMLVSTPQREMPQDAVFWDGEALDVNAAPSTAADAPAAAATPDVAADDLAYVMYTSGSTGRPKGVLVPHRGVLRLAIDNDYAQLGTDDVLLQLSPMSFDASTFEIWGALLNGGTLAMLPGALGAGPLALDDIAQAITQYGVTTLWLTAGLFHLMLDHQPGALRPLRQLLAGGDVLSPPHVLRALRALPQTRIINGYGPTENTTFSCCYTIPKDYSPHQAVPIGKAIAGAEAHVLDEAGQPVDADQEGELYVGGAGLAHGYLNRPDLTAERFLPHPFSATPGARLYRTGDRVRRDGDGNLHFLGRADRQIKINGKRIELDEIEACLRRSPLVRDAAAISWELAGQRRVAAFVTPAATASADIATPLRGFLRQELPDYMQPSALTVLAELPLSPTGKIDRAHLPLPEQDGAPQAAAPTAATTDVEAGLLQIWQQALGTRAIDPKDNFFDLGGTSMQLIHVHAAIQAGLKSDIKLLDLYKHPSIVTLAAWIRQDVAGDDAQSQGYERGRRLRAALNRARPQH